MLSYLLDLLYLVDWARLRRGALEIGMAILVFSGLVMLLTWPTMGHLAIAPVAN